MFRFVSKRALYILILTRGEENIRMLKMKEKKMAKIKSLSPRYFDAQVKAAQANY